ncbi:hypothetical protein Ciccas_004800 [Cichlidogyrus casuarinus]|uniref:Uncharacterized protein n=1 Tax=Cichlidogyrus casuarinus TaxID=1844966 RepID=A0ABD2QAI1_9PLAT
MQVKLGSECLASFSVFPPLIALTKNLNIVFWHNDKSACLWNYIFIFSDSTLESFLLSTGCEDQHNTLLQWIRAHALTREIVDQQMFLKITKTSQLHKHSFFKMGGDNLLKYEEHLSDDQDETYDPTLGETALSETETSFTEWFTSQMTAIVESNDTVNELSQTL